MFKLLRIARSAMEAYLERAMVRASQTPSMQLDFQRYSRIAVNTIVRPES